MMDDLEKFLDFLYGSSVGYVYAPNKEKDQTWNKKFFSWPSDKERLIDYIKTTGLESDVYVAPSLFSEKRATKEFVKSTSVVWVEFDGKTEIDFQAIKEPDVIVRTSSATHQHCYWKTGDLPRESVEEINRRLTYYFEADSSGWDATQVLRPPGTFNHKTSKPKPVTLEKFNPGYSDFSEFDSAPVVSTPVEVFTYDSLLEYETIKVPKDVESAIINRVVTIGGRSSHLMYVGHSLAELGYDKLEIVSILYYVDCKIKKFVGRNDQLLRLSEIASIAISKIEQSTEAYSPLEILELTEDLDWILGKWLHSRGMMFVSGSPSVGKTQLTFDMTYHLATGSPFLERLVSQPQKVLYFSLEMEIPELKYIFDLQKNAFSELALWNQNVKVVSFDEISFVEMERVIKKYSPNVIFIDSLSELMSDDESGEKEAKAIMRWIKKMRRKYNCAFVVIHHNRKASDTNKKPKKLSDLYGSFIFAAKAETVVCLWADEDSEKLELVTLKARFDKQHIIEVTRTEYLTFEVKKFDVTLTKSNPLLGDTFRFG